MLPRNPSWLAIGYALDPTAFDDPEFVEYAVLRFRADLTRKIQRYKEKDHARGTGRRRNRGRRTGNGHD